MFLLHIEIFSDLLPNSYIVKKQNKNDVVCTSVRAVYGE